MGKVTSLTGASLSSDLHQDPWHRHPVSDALPREEGEGEEPAGGGVGVGGHEEQGFITSQQGRGVLSHAGLFCSFLVPAFCDSQPSLFFCCLQL